MKRHRVPRGTRSGADGEYWHWTQLNIGNYHFNPFTQIVQRVKFGLDPLKGVTGYAW